MKRILFVDDQADVLAGLKNLLRPQRREWKMVFAEGGDAAFEAMDAAPFDVIVTDMRMPGRSGVEVLEKAHREFPKAARIVLSGYSEMESVLRTVPIAHQFLAKPCGADVLRNVVERACALQDLVNDEALQRVIGEIETLPPLPRLYAQLTKVLADPDTGVSEITEILQQDIAMSAKILQLVNSAFFTTGMEITDINFAVSRLGFEMVKNLAFTAEIFGGKKTLDFRGFSQDELQKHSMSCGGLAREFADSRAQGDDAFMAGVLHDIGKLLMAMKMPAALESAIEVSRKETLPLYMIEERQLKITHAEVGAYLLGLWGLPYPIVEAVAKHHRPNLVQSEAVDILTLVHVADALLHEIENREEDGAHPDLLDYEYLEGVDALGRLDGWREQASEFLKKTEVNAL